MAGAVFYGAGPGLLIIRGRCILLCRFGWLDWLGVFGQNIGPFLDGMEFLGDMIAGEELRRRAPSLCISLRVLKRHFLRLIKNHRCAVDPRDPDYRIAAHGTDAHSGAHGSEGLAILKCLPPSPCWWVAAINITRAGVGLAVPQQAYCSPNSYPGQVSLRWEKSCSPHFPDNLDKSRSRQPDIQVAFLHVIFEFSHGRSARRSRASLRVVGIDSPRPCCVYNLVMYYAPGWRRRGHGVHGRANGTRRAAPLGRC